MKSRKMPKALGQSYQKVNINQTLCPVLLRIFFKCEKQAFFVIFFFLNSWCCSKSLLSIFTYYCGDTVCMHPKGWHVIHFKASHQRKKALCK